jgi:hypothetical protein
MIALKKRPVERQGDRRRGRVRLNVAIASYDNGVEKRRTGRAREADRGAQSAELAPCTLQVLVDIVRGVGVGAGRACAWCGVRVGGRKEERVFIDRLIWFGFSSRAGSSHDASYCLCISLRPRPRPRIRR